MKKSIIISLVSLSLLVFLPKIASAEGAAIVSLNPSSPTVNVGDSFTVTLRIDNAVDIYAVASDISFDSLIVSYDHSTISSDISNSGWVSVDSDCFPPSSDCKNIQVSAETLNFLSGNANLITLFFTANSAGSSDIIFTNNSIIDSNFLEPIPTPTWTPASVIINAAPLSNIATVTSAIYTVGATTIANVPFGTSKTTFLAALTKGETNQTWNSTSIADPVVNGNTLVVTAQDQTTIVTYTATVVAPPDLPCYVEPKTIRAYSVIDGNAIRLVWPANGYRQELHISRRIYSSHPSAWQNWTSLYDVTTGANQAGEYRDTNVTSGIHYEYQIRAFAPSWTCNGATNNPYWTYQYINTGTNVPLTDQHGKLILLVESSLATPLSTEISRLQDDLLGDGYKVYRHDVTASEVTDSNWKASVANTKALIRADYNTDVNADWTIFIVGHVPIPYSGVSTPGGHTDNNGAHPADWYYADMDESVWTDTTANNITASFSSMWNIPGDGKFDQNAVPSVPEMRLGRVDFRNMPAFSKSEVELTRQYLDRDHAWRNKQFTVRDRGLVNANNNHGLLYKGLPPDSHNTYSSFFGGSNNTDIGDWFSSASSPQSSYLFAASKGNGEYAKDIQIGSTADFAAHPLYVVFTTMYGSYYGDWDSGIHADAVLHAPLAAEGYALTNYYHENMMNIDSSSMGMPIGDELFTMALDSSQSATKQYVEYGWVYNGNSYLKGYRPNNYVTLMGDPTLQTRVVAPPTNVTVSVSGADNVISWTLAADTNIQGYHVYRAPTTNLNNFTRLTSTPVTTGSFRDVGAAAGAYRYMVRTVKLEQSANRSYYNASQGVFVTGTSNPDIASVAADKAALVDNSIKGANFALSNITVALTNPLPSTGANGSIITWVSNTPSVVSNNGQTINRPAFASGNATVTITATITKGVVTDTKTFSLTVTKLPASNDLVLHLDFSNNWSTNGSVTDISGTGNTATCQTNFQPTAANLPVTYNQCPSKITGPTIEFSAASFSGSVCRLDSDYFGVNKSASLDNLTQGTITAWVYYNPDTDPNFQIPFTTFRYQKILDTIQVGAQGTWTFSKDFRPITEFKIADPNNTIPSLPHESTGAVSLLQFPDATASGSWHYYTITWDGTNFRGYYDGNLFQTTSQTGMSTLNLGQYLAIGALKHNTGRNALTNNCINYYQTSIAHYNYPANQQYVMPNAGFLEGKLADIRVYNRALTATEIQSFFQPSLDTAPPTITTFTIPATASALTVSILALTATDTVGVTGYLVNESSTKPLASAVGWSASAPSSYTFTTAGSKTLYAWAKDGAGNVSAGANRTVTITIITVPTLTSYPAASITTTAATLNGSVTANGGANAIQHGFAYGTVANLSTAIATTTGGAFTGTGAIMSASARNISGLACATAYYFRPYATNSVGTGYGAIASFTTSVCPSSTKAITAFNFSSPAVIGVVNEGAHTISLTVPFGTSLTSLTPTITITGVSVSPTSGTARNFTSPATYTVTAANATTQAYVVTVNISANPDIASVAADKAALVDNSIKGANFALSNITVALTNPLPSTGANGSTITWVSNNTSVVSNNGQTINRPAFASGNATVTMTAAITKGVVSDTKVFTLTVTKLPASAITTITSVTYTVGATTIANVPFGTSKTTFLAALTKGETNQTWNSTSIADPVVTGNTLVVTAQDQTTIVTYTVTVVAPPPDNTAPIITAFTIPSAGNNLTILITLFTATDDVAVRGYKITELSIAPLADDSDWSATAPISYMFTNVGSKTLYAWAKDGAGNVSTSLSATIVVDNLAPSKPTGLGATANSSSQIALSWTASTDDIGPVVYNIFRNSTTTAAIATTTGTSYSDSGLSSATQYTYYVSAYDHAGNISEVSAGASATTGNVVTPPSGGGGGGGGGGSADYNAPTNVLVII
ncbi:MAG: hypothetical protein Q7K33_01280, partial [Candidatus Berkelbacteria bacterium]|nr:hypothetical protein [Candidatus Berkelbacteria bacterium]